MNPIISCPPRNIFQIKKVPLTIIRKDFRINSPKARIHKTKQKSTYRLLYSSPFIEQKSKKINIFPQSQSNHEVKLKIRCENKPFMKKLRKISIISPKDVPNKLSMIVDNGALNRIMFKRYYSITKESEFNKNMTIFHDYFQKLCKDTYPYNMISKGYEKVLE